MENEVELNVVLLPPPEIRDIAIDVSRKLRESFPVDFVLDGKELYPHFTVYQSRYPSKNLEAITGHLKTIAKKIAPFEVSLGKISNFEGYIFWIAEMTNEFMHLNKSIIYQLNPLREGLIPEGLRNGNFNMSNKYNIQNYGSLLVGSDDVPLHITVSHLKNSGDVKSALSTINPRVAKFTVKEMNLGLLGKFGTVTEILDTFPFEG